MKMKKRMMVALTGVALAVGAETLENEALQIEFRCPADGLGVAGITDRASGVRFVRGSETGADLWALVFHGRDATNGIVVANLDNRAPAVSREVRKSADAWELVWKGLDLPGEKGVVDVTATVRLAGAAAASSWDIAVDCRSDHWALYETQYPYLRHIVDDGAADVLMPAQGLGARVFANHVAPAVPEAFNYPGWYPMVAAYMQGGTGLYFAALDGKARNKRMLFLKDHDLRLETVVEEAGVVGAAAKGPGYPVVLATYRGDWWEAAKLYRRWALKQKWCAKGKMIDRADYPRRMSETHAWLLCVGGPGGASNFVTNIRRKWPDARFGVEWTQWGNQPFDVNYPEMLPAQRHVDETMAYATAIGVPLMPYMNGRLWDTELASWHYAQKDCTWAEDGQFQFERYGPPARIRTFGVMCPGAAGWRACFGDYVVRLCDVTKCGYVYLDQIACSRPKPCFEPAHGHARGGGSWWSDGQRQILEPVRRALAARNVPITSEGAGEYLLDVIDGYLLACAPRVEDVPFYTAVYGGYATYFGSYLKPGTAFDAYYAISARALVWGVAPGWYHMWPNEDRYRRWGDALADLARVREAAKEFLAYGSLEGAVALREDVGEVSLAWPNPMGGDNVFSGTFPGVIGTWWKDARGERTAVALANVSDTERRVSFARPFAGSAVLPAYSVRVVKED